MARRTKRRAVEEVFVQPAAADANRTASIEELVGALETAAADSDGYTAKEIAAKVGRTRQWVLERLHPLAESGKVTVGKRRVIRIDGVPGWVPVFRLRLG